MIKLDDEDREALQVVGAWVLRWAAVAVVVLCSAVVLGVAWRVFDLIRG